MYGFADAILALKKGHTAKRTGWNGKNMFVFLQKGSHDTANAYPSGMDHDLFEAGDTGTATRMPCLCLHAADGTTVTGWLASQTDMLADDWIVGED